MIGYNRNFKGQISLPFIFLFISLLNIVAQGGLRRPNW